MLYSPTASSLKKLCRRMMAGKSHNWRHQVIHIRYKEESVYALRLQRILIYSKCI